MANSKIGSQNQIQPTAELQKSGSTPSAWIVSQWADMAFFVATPLLIIPAIFLLHRRFPADDIGMFVAAFGATGHHLPGILRAYGDRDLFRRFRTRFILAPLFLFTVCAVFAQLDLQSLGVLVLLWGVWHGAMQVYGFLRIYDAKVRSVASWTARWDLWMCWSWFGAGILASPDRLGDLLQTLYKAGCPLLPVNSIGLLTQIWFATTAIVTAGFLVNLSKRQLAGEAASPLKLLTMVSSIGFWWFAMVGLKNIILGVAMFELFHDIQYLAIVWIFNRKRVEANASVGAFAKFLFRRSWLMVGVYVGLVLGYGYLTILPSQFQSQTITNSLFGLIVASALLHFYYDGFIWKVRESSIQQGLGLRHGHAKMFTLPNRNGLLHLAKWGLFVVPLYLLASGQMRSETDVLARLQNVVAAAPDCVTGRLNLGASYRKAGDLETARGHLTHVANLAPHLADAHYELGMLYLETDEAAKARAAFQQTLDVKPKHSKAHSELGLLRFKTKHFKQAHESFSAALAADPFNAQSLTGLGDLHLQIRDFDAAEQYYYGAIGADQNHTDAIEKLGKLFVMQNRFADAEQTFTRAVQTHPQWADGFFYLGGLAVRRADLEAARSFYHRAIAIDPDHVQARAELEKTGRKP
ncbi:MAG: tetratricopeptide repeat protein, partial [Pirellulaceae bacterium]|nr:tetratricopeptide repeat protein [Pirellulaceae bacterium]